MCFLNSWANTNCSPHILQLTGFVTLAGRPRFRVPRISKSNLIDLFLNLERLSKSSSEEFDSCQEWELILQYFILISWNSITSLTSSFDSFGSFNSLIWSGDTKSSLKIFLFLLPTGLPRLVFTFDEDSSFLVSISSSLLDLKIPI